VRLVNHIMKQRIFDSAMGRPGKFIDADTSLPYVMNSTPTLIASRPGSPTFLKSDSHDASFAHAEGAGKGARVGRDMEGIRTPNARDVRGNRDPRCDLMIDPVHVPPSIPLNKSTRQGWVGLLRGVEARPAMDHP
jgi:hypothetical protein